MVLIDPEVKINGAYYRDVLLSEHLLPVIRNPAPEGCFIFRQDSAPTHRARETIEMLTRETPDFISPTLWSPNSPDLNPVDYKVWSVMKERVYQTAIHDVNNLKQRTLVGSMGWSGSEDNRRCRCPMAQAPPGLRASRRRTF